LKIMIRLRSSREGVGGIEEHAAHAGALLSVVSEADVAVLTPCWSPRVPDNEVTFAISNGDDSVIELSSASGIVDDAALVELEWWLVGLNGNGDWVDSNGFFECLGVPLLDLNIVRDGGSDLRSVVLAVIIGSGVGIVLLGFEAIVLDVFEALSHQASAAAVVAVVGGAVNELLLGEGKELASGNGVAALNGGNGGESPA